MGRLTVYLINTDENGRVNGILTFGTSIDIGYFQQTTELGYIITGFRICLMELDGIICIKSDENGHVTITEQLILKQKIRKDS